MYPFAGLAVEIRGVDMGQIRLAQLPNLNGETLQKFLTQAVEPGSTIRTDGLPAYTGVNG